MNLGQCNSSQSTHLCLTFWTCFLGASVLFSVSSTRTSAHKDVAAVSSAGSVWSFSSWLLNGGRGCDVTRRLTRPSRTHMSPAGGTGWLGLPKLLSHWVTWAAQGVYSPSHPLVKGLPGSPSNPTPGSIRQPRGGSSSHSLRSHCTLGLRSPNPSLLGLHRRLR